ncbi:nucleotide-diphospho-sugar transferase [Chytriomyces sp. MP71]|nr:nucleotide-diphospho-sugar transferase [Chytriomyces sp. MP71]
MVKTTDRMSKVFTLVSSVLTHYPNMTIIVADDGHLDPAKTTKPEGPQRGFYYLPLPHDVGLSAGRNRMVDRVATKYLLTLDDDFTLTRDSPLAALLHALESRRGDSYDIAAGKIPADEGRFGVDYCGAMNVSEGRTLQLREGALGVHEGCLEVEFVPNVFVARTQFLREVLRWDETLKLGEHEDFFWRAKKLGAKVLTCPGVTFYHDQVAHWKGVTEYDRKRSRVFDFMKLALRKHNFSRLVSFGRTVMDLVLPAPASEVQVSEVLARSIKLSWRSPAASFKVLQSSDNGLHWAPVNYGQGENYEHVPQEISREPDGFQRHPDSMNWLSVYGLKPGVHYQFRIHAGNRFSFREGGVEISATTLTLRNENVRNLLENPSFESGSTSPYRISQNNTFAFVPIVNMDSADGALVKFKRSSSTGFRSEVTTVGYLFAHRTLAAIAQVVPGLRFASPRLVPGGMAREAGTGEMGRIILASMQSRVDALFDGDGMSWRANLKVWFKKHGSVSVCEMAEGEGEWNGTREPLLEWGMPDIEVKEEFDRSNLEWQGRTLSVCVAEGWMERVRAVELAGILETYRGSVTYDDWVLVTN